MVKRSKPAIDENPGFGPGTWEPITEKPSTNTGGHLTFKSELEAAQCVQFALTCMPINVKEKVRAIILGEMNVAPKDEYYYTGLLQIHNMLAGGMYSINQFVPSLKPQVTEAEHVEDGVLSMEQLDKVFSALSFREARALRNEVEDLLDRIGSDPFGASASLDELYNSLTVFYVCLGRAVINNIAHGAYGT